MHWLEKRWYQKSPFAWYQKPLISLSYLYKAVMRLRAFLYRVQLIKTTHFLKPVVVVGNITTGGTGKTPTVVAIVKLLRAQGFKPGIVSRGYKAKARSWPQVVTETSLAEDVGDEPLLLFHKTGCPVVVDPKRVRAVKTLLARFDCDVVVSDDGLQHLALGRDLEVAVYDGVRGVGNGYCLPAGPLREPITRLDQVEFVLVRDAKQPVEYPLLFEVEDVASVTNPSKTIALSAFEGAPLHAVAGIGNPERFFTLLKAKGLLILPHAFSDHHNFVSQDFAFLSQEQCVIMTEKDAVKCRRFADERFYQLSIAAKFNTSFESKFLQSLSSVMRIKQSAVSMQHAKQK